MREKHPYREFIPKGARMMIVGSFPIAKFSNPSRRHEIKKHEFDFFFGGEKNLLWKLIAEVYGTRFENAADIKALLTMKGIAVGDLILSCRRKNGGASDSDLYDIKWNTDLLNIINSKGIKKLLFTSKKVELWFNKLFPEANHLEKVTLISPSAQIFRSLHKRDDYKSWVKHHPDEPKYNFILSFYKEKFETHS